MDDESTFVASSDDERSDSSLPGLRYWVNTEAGIIFSMSKDKIDSHFHELALQVEKRHKRHGDLLLKLVTLLVYRQHNKIPKSIQSLAEEAFPNAEDDIERQKFAEEELETQIDELQVSCLKSEDVNKIGHYVSPLRQCLEFVNQYISIATQWRSMTALRDSFDEENREYIIDYFIDKAKEVRETKYDVYLEQMMTRVHSAIWKQHTALDNKRGHNYSLHWRHSRHKDRDGCGLM